jgi:hypothetical protein
MKSVESNTEQVVCSAVPFKELKCREDKHSQGSIIPLLYADTLAAFRLMHREQLHLPFTGWLLMAELLLFRMFYAVAACAVMPVLSPCACTYALYACTDCEALVYGSDIVNNSSSLEQQCNKDARLHQFPIHQSAKCTNAFLLRVMAQAAECAV